MKLENAMNPPNSHENRITVNTPAPPRQTGAGSDYWLGQIVVKLENIEKKIDKVEMQENRLVEVEKDVLSTKKDISNIETDLSEIKHLVQEPKKVKASWWQITSGVASIGSIILVLAVLLPVLSSIQN